MSTNLNSHRHCVYKINLHIVFVTKYRRKVITSEILARMEEIFSRICAGQKSKLVEFGGESDHVLKILYPKPRRTRLVVIGCPSLTPPMSTWTENAGRLTVQLRTFYFFSPSAPLPLCLLCPSALGKHSKNEMTILFRANFTYNC